jgi:16S rRNA G1207 methylase RsmC
MTDELYRLPPEKILKANLDLHLGEVEGIDLKIFPGVHPSHKFRTTSFLLRSVKEFLPGSRVLDMGCGPGIVGLYSLKQKAEHVVFADINPLAIQNSIENARNIFDNSTNTQYFVSNCFDSIDKQTFDTIIWNIPFHSSNVKIENYIDYSLYDPGFKSLRRFLSQSEMFLEKDGFIFIAFSNKGDVKEVESIFDSSAYKWKIWKIANQDQLFDNRIYMLRF